VAVPEHARGKDRKRNQRVVAARKRADEFRARKFGNVEFLSAPHAVKDFARSVDGDVIEIDTLWHHIAGTQCRHAIVVAAGEAQS